MQLTKDPIDWAYHLIMPWTALAILFIGFYSRVLRSNVLDTINEDYVRTARAKGLSERRVLIAHVLRNSMIPSSPSGASTSARWWGAARSSPRPSSISRV